MVEANARVAPLPLPSHGRHSSVVLTTTFRVRWSHSALYIPHHRERMVGVHRGIMENERENLHQPTGARGFSRSFSMISRWIPTILFLSWGTFFSRPTCKISCPTSKQKKSQAPQKQKTQVRDEVFRFAWPWWLSPPYLFESYL